MINKSLLCELKKDVREPSHPKLDYFLDKPINHTNEIGSNILFVYLYYASTPCVERIELIYSQAGFNKDYRTKANMTALHMACNTYECRSNPSIFLYLINEVGLDVG